jgi:hypothetical protein
VPSSVKFSHDVYPLYQDLLAAFLFNWIRLSIFCYSMLDGVESLKVFVSLTPIEASKVVYLELKKKSFRKKRKKNWPFVIFASPLNLGSM